MRTVDERAWREDMFDNYVLFAEKLGIMDNRQRDKVRVYDIDALRKGAAGLRDCLDDEIADEVAIEGLSDAREAIHHIVCKCRRYVTDKGYRTAEAIGEISHLGIRVCAYITAYDGYIHS